jgi:hypothetical protein
MVDNLAQVVATVDLVFDLAKNLADLVFDGIRPAGLLLEAVEVGKELEVDELTQVTAGQGFVVVELAVFALRRGPALPAVVFVENKDVTLPLQPGFVGLVLLQCIEIFQEQEPGGLLGIVQLRRTTGFLPEHIVDVSKGLFKHMEGSPRNSREIRAEAYPFPYEKSRLSVFGHAPGHGKRLI